MQFPKAYLRVVFDKDELSEVSGELCLAAAQVDGGLGQPGAAQSAPLRLRLAPVPPSDPGGGHAEKRSDRKVSM